MAVLETYNGAYIWKYVPSMAAAVIFIIIFFGATGLHSWKTTSTRSWFCIPFLIGGLFETIGYIGRALAHNNTGSIGPYIIQSLLILLAPIFFAATLYMTYSRIVRAVNGDRCSFVPLRWVTRIFVLGDFISFCIQGYGGGIMSQGKADKITLGTNVIIAGLVFQVVMFAIFIACCGVFNLRFRRHNGTPAQASAAARVPWQTSLHMLYATSILVMIRNIYRVIEYAMGSDGYLLKNEWPTYVFDSTLMVLTMAAFFWRFPSMLKDAGEMGVTELTSSGGESTSLAENKDSPFGPNYSR